MSLKAPITEENGIGKRRSPVDIVAVIDVSRSMFGEKLALIKKTMKYFLTKSKSLVNLILKIPAVKLLLPFTCSFTSFILCLDKGLSCYFSEI